MRLGAGVTSLFQIAIERPSVSGGSRSVDNRRHRDPAILVEPRRLDAGDITDKGYASASAPCCRRTSAGREAVYAQHPDAAAILAAW